MSEALHLDHETRSALDLKKAGLYRYAEHPSTQIILSSYAFGKGPVKVWFWKDPIPEEIRNHIAEGGLIEAHNAAFERILWNAVNRREKRGYPEISIKQTRCTMAMAYAMGLPGSLDGAAAAAGLEIRKDAEGKALMLDMCQPLAVLDDGTITWRESEKDLERLGDYGKQDIEVSRALSDRLIRLSGSEQGVYELDQAINDFGIKLDTISIPLALSVVGQEKARLDDEMKLVTKGFVTACTQVGALKEWLETVHKLALPELGKDILRDLLKTELPGEVRQALVLRQMAAKSSVAKLEAMSTKVSSDGRIRGTLQYHGSHTGRWSGRGIQPQNFPKGKYEEFQIEDLFNMLRLPNAADSISLFYDNPLSVLSQLLRSFICADDNHTLAWGDYSSIEALILAWLAGEDFVLETHREGKCLYVEAYARSFHVDPSTVRNPSPERNIGKVQVLGLGFGGGVGAFQAMAQGFGIEITDSEANRIKEAWRQSRPATVDLWYTIERAAIKAVRYPGDTIAANGCHPGRGVKFLCKGSFLFCKLPSGRVLSYPYPKIEKQEIKKKDGTTWEKDGLTYMGEDADQGKKWTRVRTYGGKLVENIVQALARDRMVYSMFQLQANNFPVILSVHDEIVTEPKTEDCDLNKMKEIMERNPEWCSDFPMRVEVKSAKRYRK